VLRASACVFHLFLPLTLVDIGALQLLGEERRVDVRCDSSRDDWAGGATCSLVRHGGWHAGLHETSSALAARDVPRSHARDDRGLLCVGSLGPTDLRRDYADAAACLVEGLENTDTDAESLEDGISLNGVLYKK
jgi:hypothetical protein